MKKKINVKEIKTRWICLLEELLLITRTIFTLNNNIIKLFLNVLKTMRNSHNRKSNKVAWACKNN